MELDIGPLKNPTNMRNKLLLVPLGELDYILINKLASGLASFFNFNLEILPGMELPQEAYNEKRGQYYSSVILSKLELLKADDRERVLGITEEDLYVPTLNFVFGESDPESGVAVISLFNLKQDYSGITPTETMYFERIFKESVHELGHTMNLNHCPNPKCVMYFSNTILDTDRKGVKFCDNCQRNIRLI